MFAPGRPARSPVGDLLADYEGARKTLTFDDEIPADEFDDVKFVGKLHVELELTHVDYGIQAVFKRIAGDIKLPERKRKEAVDVRDVDREYKRKKDPKDPDDIGEIDAHGATIDVAPALREEAIMEAMSR